MNMNFFFIFFILLTKYSRTCFALSKFKNVLFIVADDLGRSKTKIINLLKNFMNKNDKKKDGQI